MTTGSIHSTAVTDPSVCGVLLDAVTEELVHARSPAARAEIISELVQEIVATIEWLHSTGAGLGGQQADELLSITELSRAARDHRRRMSP